MNHSQFLNNLLQLHLNFLMQLIINKKIYFHISSVNITFCILFEKTL